MAIAQGLCSAYGSVYDAVHEAKNLYQDARDPADITTHTPQAVRLVLQCDEE